MDWRNSLLVGGATFLVGSVLMEIGDKPKGDIGWWGMSSNEMDPDEWNVQLRKLIDESSDDTLFSLYDCHI